MTSHGVISSRDRHKVTIGDKTTGRDSARIPVTYRKNPAVFCRATRKPLPVVVPVCMGALGVVLSFQHPRCHEDCPQCISVSAVEPQGIPNTKALYVLFYFKDIVVFHVLIGRVSPPVSG